VLRVNEQRAWKRGGGSTMMRQTDEAKPRLEKSQ